MRILILGDNTTANALRGYLRTAGVAIVETRADITLRIDESPGLEYITVDSLHSRLETYLLEQIRRNSKHPILLEDGTHRRGEHYLDIHVPQREEARQTVERGVLQGLLEWLRYSPRKRRPAWRFWRSR